MHTMHFVRPFLIFVANSNKKKLSFPDFPGYDPLGLAEWKDFGSSFQSHYQVPGTRSGLQRGLQTPAGHVAYRGLQTPAGHVAYGVSRPLQGMWALRGVSRASLGFLPVVSWMSPGCLQISLGAWERVAPKCLLCAF